MRKSWVPLFSNYNYAVFFSHYNDKESLKINSQSQSGLKKPRNSARPALLDTTRASGVSEHHHLSEYVFSTDLEKDMLEASPWGKFIYITACRGSHVFSFLVSLSVVFRKILRRAAVPAKCTCDISELPLHWHPIPIRAAQAGWTSPNFSPQWALNTRCCLTA